MVKNNIVHHFMPFLCVIILTYSCSRFVRYVVHVDAMSQDGDVGSASLNNLTASLPVSVSNLNDAFKVCD